MRSATTIICLTALTVFGELRTTEAGIGAGQAPAPATEFVFTRHDVAIGTEAMQTVLTGFLLDGAVADLAVLTIDAQGARRLRIFAFDGQGWAPALETVLRPRVQFVDVAGIGGRDRLVTYEPGRLSWFDPDIATELPLLAATSSFVPPRAGRIPHVDISHDVNGDGREDLVVPGAVGFQVFVQTGEARFADPVTVGAPADLSRIYGADGYRYDPWSQSRVHEIDYDRDGRDDLVFWNRDRFDVHPQDPSGSFAREPVTFTTDVSFISDRLSPLTTGNMTGRVLHTLADLNDDAVADLVVFALEGTDAADKRSRYEVHFGIPAPDGGTTWASAVDLVFETSGSVQLGMDRSSTGGDNVDLMVTTIKARFLEGSWWKWLKGRMGDDVWLQLRFYRQEAGRYTGEPNAVRTVALDGVPSPNEPGWVPLDVVLRGATHERRATQEIWPRAFNPTVRVGDVTGDGLADLLIADHPRILEVWAGTAGTDLFVPRPQEVHVDPPGDEEYTWLADLDADGAQDIVMHHTFIERDAHGERLHPPGTEAQRVTLLIGR